MEAMQAYLEWEYGLARPSWQTTGRTGLCSSAAKQGMPGDTQARA